MPNPLPPTPKDEANIRRAYGQVLRNVGLTNLIKTLADVDRLLDTPNTENFSMYMSPQRFKTILIPKWDHLVFDELKYEQWIGTVDENLVYQDPTYTQTFKALYNDVFKKGILNAKI